MAHHLVQDPFSKTRRPVAPRCVLSNSRVLHIMREGKKRTMSSVRAQKDQTQGVQRLHGRTYELNKLTMLCKSPPDTISVILGPRNVGKTAILKHEYGSMGGSRCYLNCRTLAALSPGDLVQNLLELGMSGVLTEDVMKTHHRSPLSRAAAAASSMVADKLREGAADFSILGDFIPDLFKAFNVTSGTTFRGFLNLYERVLEQRERACLEGKLGDGDRWPVIIIDEAHVLSYWQKDHPEELQQLLRFFVAVTKEQCRCHVLLASSHYGFHTWLEQNIGDGFHKSYVIGAFTEIQAREFLNQKLLDLHKPLTEDDEWEQVYEVCGGNPAALNQAANDFARTEDWGQALGSVWKDIWGSVKRGSSPDSSATYTSKHYAVVVKAILDSPYHAVIEEELQAALGEGSTAAGQAALAAMLEAGMITMRPWSCWAKDIDAAAFGQEQATVVTAPTAIHLYLMKKFKGRLLSTLDSQPAAQDTMSTATSRQTPLPPSSAAAADGGGAEVTSAIQQEQLVREEISRVQWDIQEVVQEVKGRKADKGGAWDQEVAALRRKEEQMREDMRQLREELLVLLYHNRVGSHPRTDSSSDHSGSSSPGGSS